MVRAEDLPQGILSMALSGDLVPTDVNVAREERRTYEKADKLLIGAVANARSASDEKMSKEPRRLGRVGSV